MTDKTTATETEQLDSNNPTSTPLTNDTKQSPSPNQSIQRANQFPNRDAAELLRQTLRLAIRVTREELNADVIQFRVPPLALAHLSNDLTYIPLNGGANVRLEFEGVSIVPHRDTDDVIEVVVTGCKEPLTIT